MRRRLSYANVMATLAFFFALTGIGTAGVKYLTADATIPSGDLAGSVYEAPVIAAGAVTGGKIGDGAITSAKFASDATAPNADKLAGLNVREVCQGCPSVVRNVTPGEHITVSLQCPPNRLPVGVRAFPTPAMQVVATGLLDGIFTVPAGVMGMTFTMKNTSGETVPEASFVLLCLGSG